MNMSSTPTLYSGDVTLSFISSAVPSHRGSASNRASGINTDAAADLTIDLLGGRTSLLHTSILDNTMGGDLDTTTNVTQLLQAGSSSLEGSEIYEKFCEIFQTKTSPTEVFDLLTAYRSLLTEKTDVSKALIRNTTTGRHRLQGLTELHTSLRSEKWTWQLAESLLRDMVESELRNETEEDEIIQHLNDQLGSSDQQLMEDFFNKNDKVRQCQIVIDWLEMINSEDVLDNFYNKVGFFTDKTSTMWENTLHIKKDRGRSAALKSGVMVSDLDPDAAHRTGQKLSALDQEDDERLLRYLFTLIRAGKIDEAQQLCVTCGQAWRAASLEGWRLSHDPNYESSAAVTSDGPPPPPSGGEEYREQAFLGNQYRDIWKLACWQMSEEESYPIYERAIYASLSGNLDHVLPVCDSWSDALWAHIKVLVDIELEQHLRLHSSCSDHQIADLPAAYWAKTTHLPQLFKEIEANYKDSVREQSKLFFNRIQKHLILSDFDGIVSTMVETLRGASLSPHIIRFMAHFILFLRNLDKVSISDAAASEIIEEYIKYLISSKQYMLVAQYCSVLPKESQLITYALFMEGVSEKKDRVMVLDKGNECGLDMFTISRIVTENSIYKLSELIDMDTSGNEMLASHKQTEVDAIISSLDWLLFEGKHMMDAIHQCNAQMRIFLALKQHDKLRTVFTKLPSDCLAQAMKMTDIDQSNVIKEYICFKTYLAAMQSFDDWFQHVHQPPLKPAAAVSRHFAENVAHEQKVKQYEQDMRRWENTLSAMTQHTVEQLRSVLLFAGGWMLDMSHESADQSEQGSPDREERREERREEQREDGGLQARHEQLGRLREFCIPEIISLLHKVYVETEQRNECRRLAELIQSDKHSLYQTFSPNDLERMITSLMESSKRN